MSVLFPFFLSLLPIHNVIAHQIKANVVRPKKKLQITGMKETGTGAQKKIYDAEIENKKQDCNVDVLEKYQSIVQDRYEVSCKVVHRVVHSQEMQKVGYNEYSIFFLSKSDPQCLEGKHSTASRVCGFIKGMLSPLSEKYTLFVDGRKTVVPQLEIKWLNQVELFKFPFKTGFGIAEYLTLFLADVVKKDLEGLSPDQLDQLEVAVQPLPGAASYYEKLGFKPKNQNLNLIIGDGTTTLGELLKNKTEERKYKTFFTKENEEKTKDSDYTSSHFKFNMERVKPCTNGMCTKKSFCEKYLQKHRTVWKKNTKFCA